MAHFDPDVIDKANPYTHAPNFADPLFVEKQLDAGKWTFKGVPYEIEKALKIPYTYQDDDGLDVTEYLLIGFAGGGAY